MSNVAFKVYERNIKENTNKLRKTDQIPGIIYREFLDNTILIKISNAEFKKMVRENNSGSIIQIDLDGKNMNCVVKEIQGNHRQEPLHIDLQYVKPNEVIKMRIPVKFIGQSNLESRKLLLETFNPFIDFQGDVEQIPESIEVNVANLKFEDKILVEDIDFPKEVTIVTDPKTLLAVVNS